MNKKTILSLLSTPMLVSSILAMGTMVNQAQAAELEKENTNNKFTCIRNEHIRRPVCARASALAQIPEYQAGIEFSATENEVPLLAFNIEESDMAVKLFNCDCPACINTLRQMRGITPLVY
ncbi:hypothetical protein [Umezakia ovalisporum]|uniref:Uncharacterized protein n=2 Tax=Umezakia ovalisporum TaxID=75695 RepID=A0AA43KG53_9CYAN|nr:hypothetical protein [Umezakia ovalisporum]MDH6055957.1 hypothetical protein [Umezakia ovalisporum FSS-43]MDH6065321.1 hypothetical protein [Umezakia ovalisporum FSS-62]MDH6072589.1 hypothetical protein [Umezakia ovalisporum CobakiLakeA]MDH6074099.1 hypothetical protein [Umezakia ovalisporum CS-1034]MDH6079001.1 hypothetical protein [Umezakia ovalisporum FSS-45]